MKIEVGDYVVYQDNAVQKEKEDMPIVGIRIMKVIEVSGNNGEYFTDKYNEVYDHFRVRYIYRGDGKEKIEYDGYDGVRCIQEDAERLNKGV